MKIRRAQWGATLLVLLNVHAPAAALYVSLTTTHPVPPYASWSTAATNIQNAIDAANPGDQILVTNGVYQVGGKPTSDGTTNRVAVTNAVMLQSINGPTVTSIDGGKTMRCVYLTNGAVLAGFTLTNGNAGNGGGLSCASSNVLVTNCTLINNTAGSGGGAYSGTLANCTLSGNTCPITGGNGGGAAWCLLYNCTLSGNSTGIRNTTGASWGGGANACTLNNCILSGNSAYGAGSHGGGASSPALAESGSTLNNCTLVNNYTDDQGAGAYGSTLNNCLLTGNIAVLGGGACGSTLNNCTVTGYNDSAGGSTGAGTYYCTANNCIIYYNVGVNDSGSTLNNCCAPDAGGIGNITNAPLFVNQIGNNFHLQNFSPCINAGNNAYVSGTNDFDGNRRIVGGTVDVGAYENQNATVASGLPSIPATLTAVLQSSKVNLTWPVSSKATGYNVYRATTSTGPFTNIVGVAATNYIDVSIVNGGIYFYTVTSINAYGESASSPEAAIYVADHFAFAPISTLQTSSVPFTVSISACDKSGNVLSNFTGGTIQSAFGDLGNVPLTSGNTAAFSSGQWTGTVSLDPAFPDTNIRLFASSNGVMGVSNPFNSVAPSIQPFNNLTLADLVYNPFTQRLYATVPAAAGSYSNTLLVINPKLGRIETSYYLGNDPTHLAVSSDGQFLYIGFNGTNAFARFNVVSNMIDLEVPISSAAAGIAAVPGMPHSVAVSVGGIAIFDDGIQRSNTYPWGSFVIAGSADEFFTLGGGYPAAPFAILSADASGITNYFFEDGIVSYLETVKCQGGRIFTSRGTVFDPETTNILGNLTNCYIVEPNLAAGRIFSMGAYIPLGQSPDWTLYSWNSTNLQVVGSLAIPGVYDGGPINLVRWGTNGIAINFSSWYQNQLYLVRTSLIPSVLPTVTGRNWQPSGPFELNFTGDQSVPYTVLASTNLANWTQLGTPNLMSNGCFWYWDVNATNYPYRFYKVGASP